MPPLSLNQAAKACHKSKSAIIEAIRSGRLSAIRDDKNQWCIDPSELFRVYPQNQTETGDENRYQPGTEKPEENRPTTDLLVQMLKKEQEERERERVHLERERRLLESQLEDLKADRDHWRQQATNLLTHQSENKPDSTTVQNQYNPEPVQNQANTVLDQPEPAQEQPKTELEPVQKTESPLWKKLFGNR